MRNLKRLVSVVLSTAVLCSTVAFADTLDALNKARYSMFVDAASIEQGTTTFTVNIGIKDSTGATIDIPQDADSSSMFYTTLSEEAVNAGIKAVEITSEVATVVDPDCGDGEYFGCNIAFDKSDVSLSASTPIITATFTAPADLAVGSYSLIAADGEMDLLTLSDKNGNESGTIVWDDTVFVTVAAPGPVGPTATKGETAANGITEYTVANDEDLADKKVMMSPKFENQIITEATRFVVTWNGTERKFGSDLYAKLGGQEGDITIGSLTFALIVDDANANASDFTFAIN